MTADKLRQARETEVTTLVTSDPGCLLQMRGLADDSLRIEHLAVMLDRSQNFGTAPREVTGGGLSTFKGGFSHACLLQAKNYARGISRR